MNSLNKFTKDWIETEVGNIPFDWECVEFLEVGDENLKRPFISGPFGSNISSRFFVENGVPVIRGNNLKLGVSQRFFDNGFAYLTEEKADELGTYAEVDDIIFTAAGTIGQVGIIEKRNKFDKYIISNKQLRARLNKSKVLPKYCYYWFSSPIMEKVLKKRDTGSTIPLINLTILKTLPLPLPPLPEQKAIANVLTAFDDKIELLQQQNQTLESIAQTIFKQWFGKYQLGDDLPEGWRVGKLGEVVNIKQGKYVKSDKILEEKNNDFKFPVYGGGGIRGYLNNYVYESPKVILTCRGNGCGLIQLSENFSTVTNSCMALEDKNSELDYSFIYLLTSNLNFESVTSGSAQPQITVTNLQGTELIIPEKKILQKFSKIVEPLFHKRRINNTQIQSLIKTRDTLLPKLMSGQVRVKM